MAIDSISPEFRSVRVWPSWGTRTAVVSWEVSPGIASGDFYVYRSPDGLAGWTLLNPETPVNGSSFADSTLQVEDRTRVVHYRVMCEVGGTPYDSPIVGMFSGMSETDLRVVNRIMQEELRSIRTGGGSGLLLYPSLLSGLPCPAVDKATGAHYGAGCAGTPDDCYGTGFVGGYGKPLPVWGIAMAVSPRAGKFGTDGEGETDTVARAFRLLSCAPQRGDLLVDPVSDDRYMVGDGTKTSRFKGVCPLFSMAETSLLPRNHDAYRVAVPEEYSYRG